MARCKITQPKAIIISIEPDSPADDAGFYEGCCITAVDGHPIRDIIDWRWYSAEDEIVVSYVDGEGDEGDVELYRDEGESWGFTFHDVIFDDIIECRNACIFCFMRQLPEDARDTLVLRDDDYRLSFLQGNFVTFTNVRPQDELRIIEQHISPLRFSLHCITPELRRKVIGKHAAHGVEVAQRLMDAGIDLHVQIVLMPGINDGEELQKTLEWCYLQEGVMSVGIVPLGFTKYQDRFTQSFNDPTASKAVIGCIRPLQERALRERGEAWVHAADEFYSNAFGDGILEELPPTHFYGDFELFEDGIGIIRSFVDDWFENLDVVQQAADALEAADAHVMIINGCAMAETLGTLIDGSPLKGRLIPKFVKNDYFGGNVDVTGLLCGCDILSAIADEAKGEAGQKPSLDFVIIPKVVLNSDSVTLDDMPFDQLQQEAMLPLHVVSCIASEYLNQIIQLLAG